MKKWLLKIGKIFVTGLSAFVIAICFSTIVQAFFQAYFVLPHIFIIAIGVTILYILSNSINLKKTKKLDISFNKDIVIENIYILIGIVSFFVLLNISLLNEEIIEIVTVYIKNATNYDTNAIQTIPPMLRDIVYSSFAMLISKEVVLDNPNIFVSYLHEIEIVHFAIRDLFVVQTLGCLFFIFFVGNSILKLQNYNKKFSV